MHIIKQINNNAALGRDGNGNEVIVLGRGVGFPAVPYELTDLSLVDRTFYDVDPRYVEMAAGLPQPLLLASADVAEQAEDTLDCLLNPNLPFTLADHLQFAMERVAKGIDITTPLAYDVQHLYPQEYKLGQAALDILGDHTGQRLPDSEAVNVALHLINAEAETGDMHSLMLAMQVISEVDSIIEHDLGITLDRNSFHYSRFSMHLRYLIQRLASGQQVQDEAGASMLHSIAREYPAIYTCARKVAEHLNSSWGWQCSQSEVLYLMLHINRLREATLR